MTTVQHPQPTRPQDAPGSGVPADDDASNIPEPPRLSGIQIVASALAAVSSTLALSYLGVAGTIIGAGIASVLTVVGNYVYTRSILRAHRQVKAVRPGRTTRATTAAGSSVVLDAARVDVGPDATVTVGDTTVELVDASTSPTAVQGVLPGFDPDPAGASSALPPDETDDDAVAAGAPVGRRTRRRLVVACIAVFGIILAGITAFEMVVGKPLTDVLNGTDGSGSSISHVVTRDASPADDAPADDAPADDAPAVDDGNDAGTTDGTDGTGTDGTGTDGTGTDGTDGTGTDGTGTDGTGGTGTDSGTDGTGTDSGTDSGTDTGTDPAPDPETDTGTDPGAGTGTDTGAEATPAPTVTPSVAPTRSLA